MLTQDQIKKTVTDYFKDKPVKKVYLFGSCARGDANEESDVDLSLVLRPDARVSYFTLATYLLDLEHRLNKKVDLVEEQLIYEHMRGMIEHSKVLILSNKA